MEPEEWDTESWKSAFASIVKLTVQRSEEIPDVIEGAYALGERRAQTLGRGFWPGEDVVYAMTLFCWWPFKPAMSISVKAVLQELRGPLFKHASRSYSVRANLVEAIPRALLELNTEELHKVLLSGVVANTLADQRGAPA